MPFHSSIPRALPNLSGLANQKVASFPYFIASQHQFVPSPALMQKSKIPLASKPPPPSTSSSSAQPTPSSITPPADVTKSRVTSSIEKHIERIRSSRQPANQYCRPTPSVKLTGIRIQSTRATSFSSHGSRQDSPTMSTLSRNPGWKRECKPLRSALKKFSATPTFCPKKKVHWNHHMSLTSELRIYYVPEGHLAEHGGYHFYPDFPGKKTITTEANGKRYLVKQDSLWKDPTQEGNQDITTPRCLDCVERAVNPGEFYSHLEYGH
ncbi:hypothetical protein BP6252_13408 [Coleophoma cylindrospora]|uniref:Uncharacterized protein n=1 Tax=Coleophoma cylindrospora TaxID=1849047 RepID=A0A3D8Q8K5_9HELO|nr:hypothetical protein BP6252_13408 [Coleophoma cylindrospora]